MWNFPVLNVFCSIYKYFQFTKLVWSCPWNENRRKKAPLRCFETNIVFWSFKIFRRVFRPLWKIYDGAFRKKPVIYFCNKPPSEMFDKVLKMHLQTVLFYASTQSTEDFFKNFIFFKYPTFKMSMRTAFWSFEFWC